MLKDIALEAIMRDPWLWVDGTIEMFGELLKGAPKEESVRWHQEVHEQPSVANQWDRFNYLLESAAAGPGQRGSMRPRRWADLPPDAHRLGHRRARAWSARRWRCWCRRYRPALLPFLVTFVLMAASAALVGDVPRYRYPVDPLMYVLAAGGLVGLASLAIGLARRERSRVPRPGPLPASRARA